MTTRVLVTLAPGADPDRVIPALSRLDAASVQPPAAELPGVAVAEVADPLVDAFIADAVRIAGVAVAERDAFSFTDPPALPGDGGFLQ